MKRIYIFIFACLFFSNKIYSQQCNNLGQTPATAFPVCGITSFAQQSVPICDGGLLFVPGCSNSSGSIYTAKNPFWYKFTCYQTGTLSFIIKPIVPGDDYDWQLYDITGLSPNAVFNNNSTIITGNWAGSPGNTGTSSTGVNFIQCSSLYTAGAPTFAQSPILTIGRDYLLMVSHYDNTQTGYTLAFGGGTASINDPLDPILKTASAPCDGTEIRVKLNKKVKCNSLVSDGSDFEVVDALGNITAAISAISDDCTRGFDFDSLSVFMPTAFAPGTYTIRVKNGSDGNTLQDNCDKLMPINNGVQFTVYPLFSTRIDSIAKIGCAPDSIVLFFKKNIKCSSIEPNGTDFNITGPYPVTIIAAAGGNCVRGGTNKIVIKLAAPMQVAGSFLVNLKVGADGNTLLDECDVQTPLPDNIAFITKDTVNADFGVNINFGCLKNIVTYTHNGANTVNFWSWSFTGTTPTSSNLQNPIIDYTNFEPKVTQLIVSNGTCSDTSKVDIVFDNYLKADFEVSPVICPSNPAVFINKSVGTITDWQWTIGNGYNVMVKDPLPQVFVPLPTADYNALPELLIKNNYGCFAKIIKPIKIVNTCFIAVPSAFSPNGDGKNDFLYPLKAYKSSNLSFSVYNRFGERLFYGNDWQQKWDGKYKGVPQIPGTYIWILEYTNIETGKKIFEKGTTILIR